jgi:hypothetical protein
MPWKGPQMNTADFMVSLPVPDHATSEEVDALGYDAVLMWRSRVEAMDLTVARQPVPYLEQALPLYLDDLHGDPVGQRVWRVTGSVTGSRSKPFQTDDVTP